MKAPYHFLRNVPHPAAAILTGAVLGIGAAAWFLVRAAPPRAGVPVLAPEAAHALGPALLTADALSQAQVAILRSGMDQTLTGLQSNLVSQVLADTLPVLGNHLEAAALSGVAQLQYLTAVKASIASGLDTLTGSADFPAAQVKTALDSALAGLGSVNVNFSNPGDVKLTFTTAKNFAALSTAVAGNLGLPGLNLSTSGVAQTTFNYSFQFTTGIDAAGFYLATAAGQSNFQLAAVTTLPGFHSGATLSLLRFTATNSAVTPTNFAATFHLQLKDPGGDGRLRPGELGGDLLDATLSGQAAVNLDLTGDLDSAALPDINVSLGFHWSFSNSVVDAAAGSAGFGNVPAVTFRNISLGLGSFFGDFVDPVFGVVQTLTDPLQPIVDALLTEVGFLTDLAGEPVTLIDIAGGIGALDAETAARLVLYADLINFINAVPSGLGDARIDLGDFSLGTQDPRGALFHLAEAVPQSIRNAIAPGSQNGDLGNFLAGKEALPGGGLSFPIIENPATVINLLFGKPVDFFTYHVPGLDIDGVGFDEFYRLFGPFGVRFTATVEAHAFLDIGYDSSGLTQFAETGDPEDIFNGLYVVDQPGGEGVLTVNLQAFAAVNVFIAEMGVGGGITGDLKASLNDTDFTPGDGRIHLAELNSSCVFSLSGEVVAGLSAYLEIGIGPFSETFEENFGTEVLTSFNVSNCDTAGIPGVPVLAHQTGANVGLHVGADASLRQIGTLEDSAEDFNIVHVSGPPGSEVVDVIGNGLRNENGTPVAPQPYTVGANGRINANGGEKDDNIALSPDLLSPSSLHGGAGNDRLVGGAGIDLLYGDAGLDLLVGGAGNDAMDGGADEDFLDGQDDDDVLFGGSGSDILLGGAGADELNGGPGYDTATYVSAPIGIFLNIAVPGSGGGDAQGDTYVSIERIVGSPFADILFGSAGSENFGGGAGDDVLDGTGGDDYLVGDAGADTLTGGPGTDFAAYTTSPAAVGVSLLSGLGSGGDAAGDTLSGIENLQGSDFGDTLEGDNGANWLRGLYGHNILRGFGGNDRLEGSKDNDLLEGGADSDTLRASQDVASLDPMVSGGIDALFGGPGDDFLHGDAGGDILDGGGGDDQLFGGGDNDTISGGAGHDRLYGQDGSDLLAGDSGNDLIEGGSGNDVITVGAIRGPVQDPDRLDKLSGGSGFDIVSADFSNQTQAITIVAGQTNSLVFPDGAFATGFENVQDFLTGAGDDQLFLAGAGGNHADNVLDTGGGNDAVYSGAGNDTVDAGEDDDTVEGGPGADNLDGGTGRDALFYLASPQAVVVDLELSGTAGPDGSDSFGDRIAHFEDLYGSGFADELRGTAGDNEIAGGSGNDFIDGRGGHNELFGDDGHDMIFGGAESDSIFGGTGDDTIDTGGGTNSASGDDGNDGITGGAGPDTLNGGAGADTLHAGEGRNVLNGGTGNDVLSALGGDDTLNGGDDDDQLDAGDGANVLNGEAGHDRLISGSGADQIHGGTENDTAGSGAGNDLVFGEEGNDSLDAGIGADHVDGGPGHDFLSTGALRGPVQDPNRLDHLFGGAGFDTITADFSNQTVPMVVIAGLTQSLVFADGSEARDFENVHDLFTGSGNYDDVLRLDGAADDGFGNLLKTGGGNDVIHSGAGSDNVDAGDGHDFVNGGANGTQLILGGFGTVVGFSGPGETLIGGAGTDTLSFEGYVKATGIPPGQGYHTHFGVLVDLGTNATDGAARGITISGFENITGTEYGDSLTGNDGPNFFNPLHGGGSVNIAATGGPDRVDGKGGLDTLFIDFSREDLPTSTGITSGAGGFTRQTPASPFSSQDQTFSSGIEIFHIIGAGKNDQLAAQAVGFNDILIGLGGNDTLGGRSGSDTLRGGDGHDLLTGQGGGGPAYDGTAGGHDVFDGGAGDDRIEDLAISGTVFTALGVDALFQLDGGAGYDTFSADFSNQTAAITWDSASPTDMTFADGAFYRGFEQMRTFASGPGHDSITQLGRLDNVFSTGNGDDTVAPGLGLDEVHGGAGDDLLVLDFSIGDEPAYTGIYGLVYFGGGYTGSFSRSQPGVGIIDRIGIAGFERLHLTGTPHADTMGDLTGDDIIFGLGGNDTITGVMGGNGYFDGGEGNDTITGFGGGGGLVVGDETLIGGGGNDTLNGEAGNDTLLGGPGDDVLIGAGNSGVLRGGLDFIDGGEGDDFVDESYAVTGDFSYMPTGTRLQLDGGPGFDTLSADFGNQMQSMIFDAAHALTIEFSDGGYIRNFEAIRDLTTGAGHDVVSQPGRLANQFSTRGGDDTVNPGLGIDIVQAGSGSDDDLLIVDYSLGDDANLGGFTFVNGSGSRRDTGTNAIVDSIQGAYFERYQITGGSKADSLTGGNGADILMGHGGHDTLHGDRGNDVIDGGPGDDRVSVDATVNAAMLDQLDGGAGFDVLVAARFSDETAPVLFDSRAPTDTYFASGAYFRRFEQIEWLVTGSGADVLAQLGRVNNHFETNGGDDTIVVGLGIDDIFAGPGTDMLIVDYSETGGENVRLETSGAFFYRRDVATNAIVDRVGWQAVERFQITGTKNNDAITTGALDDILNVRRGNDTATGAGGTDLLVLDWSALTSGAQGANYTAFNGATGTGTLTTSDAAGFNVAFSGIERFDLTGSGLADDLRGLGLADVLRGGAGNDTLTGGDGVDLLEGGEGDDRLEGGGGTGVNGQWASSVISFTSQYSANDWSAAQMLGAPNTFSYGSINTAWAPSASNGGMEQLLLGFATPGYATGVTIREIWGNGFVTRVDLLDINDQLHTVFTGPDPSLPGTPVDFTINFPLTSYLVKGVKIFVDKNHNLGTYEEIDAVQLQGARDAADQLFGGQGNDVYVVEAAGNVIVEAAAEGVDEVRSQVDFTLPANVENLVLSGSAATGTGNALHNTLTGNSVGNALHGGDGNDVLSGAAGLTAPGKTDLLEGGPGADLFVLGDASLRFYDDGSSLTRGIDGYARLPDFAPGAGDQLRLKGTAAEYFLAASPVAGVPGTGLFHDSDLSGLFNAGTDELIAILQSAETLTRANTIDAAQFPSANYAAWQAANHAGSFRSDDDDDGLTNGLEYALGLPPHQAGTPQSLPRADSLAGHLRLVVDLPDPGAADITFLVEASDDLGTTDQWTAIATRTGSAAWTGPARVTLRAIGGGKIQVTVEDTKRLSTTPRRFLRLTVEH